MHAEISRRTMLLSGAALGVGALSACAPQQVSYDPSGTGIVDVVVPYSTGGGTDTWARFITPYLATQQSDVDRYQIENIPGGESITGANGYVDASVTTGKQLLVGSATTYFQSMLEHPTAEFDFSRMEPLVVNGTGAVLWAGAESGITSVTDLIDRPENARYGGMSATGLDMVALLAFEAIGATVDGVFGFEGRGPTRLAVQRDETDLDLQTTATYLTQVQPMVDKGDAIPLFGVGALKDGEIIRDPNLPDVPTFSEVFEEITGSGKANLAFEAFRSFVTPGFFFQKGLWSNEGTDEDVIASYAHMVDELNADSTFLEEAKSALGGYELVSGEDARADFHEALEIDPEVLEFTKDFLIREHGAVLG